MSEILLNNEPLIRLAVFVLILLLMIGWEYFHPRRKLQYSRRKRWPHNLFIILVDSLVIRLLLPVAAVSAAMMAAQWDVGIFNLLVLPHWLTIASCIILLDAAIYFQHRIFHLLPWLWRLHRMHHTDPDFDVTTALRFHPLEILLSMLIKIAVVVVLGAPALAVLLFEILLNATAMFNHGNVRLPVGVDRYLRLLIVTPDMHRVHHSVRPVETNSNFGFNLSCWDRLFGSYRAQPAAGHARMQIGLESFRHPRELKWYRLLSQPFRND